MIHRETFSIDILSSFLFIVIFCINYINFHLQNFAIPLHVKILYEIFQLIVYHKI